MEKSPFEKISSYDESVWRSGLETLSGEFSEANCRKLIDFLSDKVWRKRDAVAKVIIQWGEAVVPIVLERFSEADFDYLYWCLFILGHFPNAAGRLKIIQFLSAPDPEIRGYAVRALSILPTNENAKSLFPLLNDSNWSVRKLVFFRLLEFGEILLDDLLILLTESKENLPHPFVALLVKVGGEKILPTLKDYYQEGSFSTRYSIVVALSGRDDNPTVDFLINVLRDPSWIIQKKVAEILVDLGEKIFERLSLWFNKVESSTKSQIISIIVKLYGERALPIIRRFLSSADVELRLIAIENLALIPGNESSRLLIEALKDPQRIVSDYASDCLGRKEKLNVDLLLEHLDSDDENVRFLVIKIIGSIGGVALNPIINILTSGKKEEKLFLLGVLQRISPTEKLIDTLLELLRSNSWPIRNSAANCLLAYGNFSVGAVIKVLNASSDDVQFWARRILLLMGGTAISSLTKVLQEGTDLALIPHVISALLAMSHVEAVPAVIKFLEKNDDQQIEFIFDGIEEIASREVIETILNLITHPNERIVSWLSFLLRKVKKVHLRKIVLIALNLPADRSRFFVIDAIKHWEKIADSDMRIFIRQLEIEKRPENVVGVVSVLGNSTSTFVIEALKKYLQQCAPDLMLDLMLILADIVDTSYETMLVEMLRTRSEVIRIEDVERVGPILGKIFRKNSEGILQGLASSNIAFRLCCVVALEQLNENRVVFSLMDNLNIKDDPIIVKRAVKILLRFFFSEDFRLRGAVTDYLLGLGTIIQEPVNQTLPNIENDIDRKALIDLLESVGGTVDPEALLRKGEKRILLSDARLDDVLEKRKKALEELEEIDTIIQTSHTQEVTIMFTDVKGYTAFSSKASLSEVMGMLKQHDDILIPIIEKNGGKVLKKIGDAFLVIFENPNQALLAAISMQRELAKFNSQAPEERHLAVRIAINHGPVVRRETDVFGEAVNLASRIEGLADAKEIVVSEFAAKIADQKVFELVNYGEHTFKGISRPIRVYKVKW